MTRPPFFIYQTFLPSRRRDCLTTIPRLHQPFQNRTIPLAFRRVSVCVCLVGFASLQSLWAFISGILALLAPSRCIDPLHFYNLFKSTSIASPRTITLASLVKGEVLSPEKIRATTGGIVTPPTLPNRTVPCFAPSHLPPLLKGGGLTARHKP